MAELATYIGVTPVSVALTAAAIGRGVRVTRNSSGLCAATAIGTRGDYVTLREGVASEVIPAVSAGSPAKVPALASEAVAVGDLAYSAANGKFSKTSTDAVLMGRWTLAASGDGVLGEVQLFSVA
jgi:hypothetical protein